MFHWEPRMNGALLNVAIGFCTPHNRGKCKVFSGALWDEG